MRHTSLAQRLGISRRRGTRPAEEDPFNEVMVQVFSAFVMFLAWIMTSMAVKASTLQTRLDTTGRAMNAAIENMQIEMEKDPGAREAEVRQVKLEAQLELMLADWAVVSSRRPMAKLLTTFEHVSYIPLDVEGSCLPRRDVDADADPAPVGDARPDTRSTVERQGFWGLVVEARRVFPQTDRSVSNDEVMKLVAQVVHKRFDPRVPVYDPELVPPEAQRFLPSEKFPTKVNLESLKKAVQADLARERVRLVSIQHRLVGRVCDARFERLLKLPLEEQVAIDTPAANSDNARERVLRDLENELYMLPEVRERIRQSRDGSSPRAGL